MKPCVHHWMLPSPNGKEAMGICRHCGKKQMHYNSLGWTQWSRGKFHHGYTKPHPRSLKSKK